MTVAEAVSILTGAKAIFLAWSESCIQINPDDMLTMDAYGKYMVRRIRNHCKEDCFEIEIAMQPVKVEAV